MDQTLKVIQERPLGFLFCRHDSCVTEDLRKHAQYRLVTTSSGVTGVKGSLEMVGTDQSQHGFLRSENVRIFFALPLFCSSIPII